MGSTTTRITIKLEGVWFNGKRVALSDSMSYVFTTEAKRQLTLRFVGMNETLSVPVWHFEVYNVHDAFLVLEQKFEGYGEFFHKGRSLFEASTSKEVVTVLAA